MAEKDTSTERAAKDAQNMTEQSPGSRDMGGKPAGELSRQNPAEDGPAVVGGRVGDQAAPVEQGRAARVGEQGQTQINTQPPNPGIVTGIGADPMVNPSTTQPLPPTRRGPVWLKNEAGEDYLAPGEGPKKGDTVELVGPSGERWAAEVMHVEGDRDSPDATLDLVIRGVPGPAAARQAGVRAEFPG